MFEDYTGKPNFVGTVSSLFGSGGEYKKVSSFSKHRLKYL